MKFPSIRAATSVVCLTFVLAACGGGEGGSSSSSSSSNGTSTSQPAAAPQITKDNYQTIAAQAYSATTAMGQSAQFAGAVIPSGVSLQTAATASLTDASLEVLYRALQNPSRNVATGVVLTQTDNCAGGGTVTATVTYSDPNGNLSNGDRVTLSANKCIESGMTINGDATVTFSGISGQPGASATWSGTLGTQYNNFSVTVGSENVVANGDLSIGLIQASSSRSLSLSNTSLSFALYRSGALRATRTVQALRGNWTWTGTTLASSAGYSLSGNGTTIGSFAGTVKTLTNFVANAGEYPHTGSAVFTSADGATVTLKAIDRDTVNIAYSAKGDGSITQQVTTTWGALDASL